MKTVFVPLTIICVCLAFGSVFVGRAQTAAKNKTNSSALPATAKPVVAKTPPNQKAQSSESLPQKIDDQTAISPIYKINSKYCENKDGQGSEGEDLLRECKAIDNYSLWAYGFDYRINYRIESKDPKDNFYVVLFPLENGEAAKYVRADLYDLKLADKIEWRLDAQGKPFAVIVRASFYKNTGSAKTFSNPKNKVAEFVFVRGLAGYEDLKTDLPAIETAFNPDEQARLVAAKFLEKHHK